MALHPEVGSLLIGRWERPLRPRSWVSSYRPMGEAATSQKLGLLLTAGGRGRYIPEVGSLLDRWGEDLKPCTWSSSVLSAAALPPDVSLRGTCCMLFARCVWLQAKSKKS
jgi:hypothetical protein